MKLVGHFRFTLLSLAMGLGLALFEAVTGIDPDHFIFDHIRRSQLDDVIVGLVLALIGMTINGFVQQSRKKQLAKIQEQRLHVLKATMRTVQDIVNNVLNVVQLITVEAHDSLPPDVLDSLESNIQDASARLRALGDLDGTPESELAIGVGIDYSSALRESKPAQTFPPPGFAVIRQNHRIPPTSSGSALRKEEPY